MAVMSKNFSGTNKKCSVKSKNVDAIGRRGLDFPRIITIDKKVGSSHTNLSFILPFDAFQLFGHSLETVPVLSNTGPKDMLPNSESTTASSYLATKSHLVSVSHMERPTTTTTIDDPHTCRWCGIHMWCHFVKSQGKHIVYHTLQIDANAVDTNNLRYAIERT